MIAKIQIRTKSGADINLIEEIGDSVESFIYNSELYNDINKSRSVLLELNTDNKEIKIVRSEIEYWTITYYDNK